MNLSLPILLTLSSLCVATIAQASTGRAAQRLSAFLDEVVSATGFSGAVVVVRDGETVFEGGWGLANRELDLAFTPDTPVDGASLAKTFVAAGLWQLQGEGSLRLDAPVSSLVPAFAPGTATVLELMRHSGGLVELDDSTHMTNLDIARVVGAREDFEPGSRFRYCNECFDVLAEVTEVATGQPWPEFLRERFFAPLGLESAFLRPVRFADWPGPRTLSYRAQGDTVLVHDVQDGERFYGSSNLYLSARDLAAWGTGLARGAVLDDDTMRDGRRQARFTSGEVSAMNDLNWYQATARGPATFDGHLRGFHSVLYWDADSRLVVAWVSNTHGRRPHEILFTRELVRLAEGGNVEGVPRFPAPRTTDSPAVAGRYDLAGIGRVDVEEEDGIVWISIDGGPRHAGYPATGYYLPDLGVEIGFDAPAHGVARRLHWISVFEVVVGARVDDD